MSKVQMSLCVEKMENVGKQEDVDEVVGDVDEVDEDEEDEDVEDVEEDEDDKKDKETSASNNVKDKNKTTATKQKAPKKPTSLQFALENKCEVIGRFWTVEMPLRAAASKHLLKKLCSFYNETMMEHLIVHRALKTLEIFKNYELSTLLQAGINGISLRCLEWLVTNYAKKHQIVLYNSEKKRRVHIYSEYMDQLDNFKRVRFDPFCRSQRIYFVWPLKNKETSQVEQVVLETTVGQMNFMQWAFNTGVLEYAQAHEEAIQNDMETTLAVVNKEKKLAKKIGVKRKRKELSKAPGVECTIYSVDTVMFFQQMQEDDDECYKAPSNAQLIELKAFNDSYGKKKRKKMGRTPKKDKNDKKKKDKNDKNDTTEKQDEQKKQAVPKKEKNSSNVVC